MAEPPTRRPRRDDDEEARYWAEEEAAHADDEYRAQFAAEQLAADRESAIETMTGWFEENFEDPQNQTPIDSEDGVYVYINGGPFDAGDVIGTQFADEFNQEWIEAAVEHVTRAGTFEWAPVPEGDFYDPPDEEKTSGDVEGDGGPGEQRVPADLFSPDPATERADTIGRIAGSDYAHQHYGDASLWTLIFAANANTLDDRKRSSPGRRSGSRAAPMSPAKVSVRSDRLIQIALNVTSAMCIVPDAGRRRVLQCRCAARTTLRRLLLKEVRDPARCTLRLRKRDRPSMRVNVCGQPEDAALAETCSLPAPSRLQALAVDASAVLGRRTVLADQQRAPRGGIGPGRYEIGNAADASAVRPADHADRYLAALAVVDVGIVQDAAALQREPPASQVDGLADAILEGGSARPTSDRHAALLQDTFRLGLGHPEPKAGEVEGGRKPLGRVRRDRVHADLAGRCGLRRRKGERHQVHHRYSFQMSTSPDRRSARMRSCATPPMMR